MERLEQLSTPRLVLRASTPDLAPSLADYLRRNREAHAQWSPPAPESFFTTEGQAERLSAAVRAETDGTQLGWFFCLQDDPARVIGHLRFSQIARGPFHSAMLGYSIDARHEGRGLMREALQAALADAFSPRVWLHRVQANARVENTRSLGLLQRLGFVREGLAKRYLYIDGAWCDHVLTALINPHWQDDTPP